MGKVRLSVIEGLKDGQNRRNRSLKADQEQCFNEDFWPAYPRKVAKYVSLQSFCRVVLTSDDLDKVLKALEWYKKHEWASRTLEKIPHASTWLNQRRFLDL